MTLPATAARVDPAISRTQTSLARRLMRRSTNVGYVLAAATLTVAVGFQVLGLTRLNLGVPFSYSGDALSTGVHVKNVLERGWISYNPFLGAPAGVHGNDFPGADNLHLIVIRVLGAFTTHYAVALNVYFLLTFPLAAAAAAAWFRAVHVTGPVGLALAVAYAYAPYHFIRGEDHLYLAAYYPVPLACLVVLRALRGEPLWTRRRPSTGWLPRCVTTFLSLVLLGTASSYYSVFTLLLLSFAAAVALISKHDLRRLLGAIAAASLLIVVMVVNMLPNLLYERAHGQNTVALVRSTAATEVYSLKLTSLLLPWPGHRIASLAALRHRYDTTFPNPAEQPALGIIASVGLLMLLGLLICRAVRPVRQQTPATEEQGALAVLALAMVLLGTVGGFASLFALFVTDNLRGWNRLSIFLMAVSLACTGALIRTAVAQLTALLDRTPPRRFTSLTRRLAPLIVSVLVLGVGLYDQTPAGTGAPAPTVLASWHSDQTFVDTLQSELPSGALIYQLPYQFFPESPPVAGLADSQQFRLYLHSSHLRWTYGAIRGRADADWPAALANLSPARLTGLLAAARVDGLEIARAGYPEHAAPLEKALASVLGTPPTASPDGDFAFFDLRPLQHRLAAEHTDPAALRLVAQHVFLHATAYPQDFPGPTPSILFSNADQHPVQAAAQVRVNEPHIPTTDLPDPPVTINWPDGTRTTTTPQRGSATFTRLLTLAPGYSTATFTTKPGATLTLQDLHIQDPILTSFPTPPTRTGPPMPHVSPGRKSAH